MKHTSRPQSIAWFQEHYKAGRLELRPPFQRKPVWTEKQRSFLIESILMDVPVPEVYVQIVQSEDGAEQFGVVDGQQRLRTILQFVGIESEEDQKDGIDNNSFVLDKLPPSSTYKDKAFADLSTTARKQFFQYEICVRFLYTDDRVKIEDVFKRLNKYTMPLKAQELRNATYHGAFAKLSEQLADDEYWAVNRIVSAAAIRRMADIEFMSDLLIGLIHGPQGGSAKVIDQYYEQYEPYDDEFPEQIRIKKQFTRSLETIQNLFPSIGEVPRWGNRTDFYSLFVALGSVFKTTTETPLKDEPRLVKELIKFATEVDQSLEGAAGKTGAGARKYAKAIEKGSNDRARRMDRHEVLVALITPFLPKRDN